jgi:hypothetical protein
MQSVRVIQDQDISRTSQHKLITAICRDASCLQYWTGSGRVMAVLRLGEGFVWSLGHSDSQNATRDVEAAPVASLH